MANSTKQEKVSGEDIITAYLSGDISGFLTYNKLCKAVDLLNKWNSQAVIDFLLQFVDIAHMLDHRCKQLLLKFAQVEWQFIPSEIRPQFVKLLRDVAVQHICHTESIIKCFVEHLFAKIQPVSAPNQTQEDKSNIMKRNTFTFSLEKKEQESIYELANDSLTFIVKCCPLATKSLVKIIRQRFPHHSISSLRYVSYIRNLILICQNIPQSRAQIFGIIIDGLAQLDAVLSKVENSNRKEDSCDDGLNVFLMDEEYEKTVTEVNDNYDKVEKLDTCMSVMFDFLGKLCKHGDPKFLVCGVPVNCKQIFDELLFVFGEHLLMAHGLKNIPFLWFYVCSLDTSYQKDFLSWLWGFVTRLNQAPNDWKKAQGAACYIGSLLSRAAYVNLSTAMEWLEILSQWCTAYVNEMIDRTVVAVAGSTRHGTFYAVFQAFLVAFCFRYREIVKAQEMVKIHRWGLGRIIHSTLEPLSYISHPVTLCFATISRSLQLVYVNHILPAKPAEMIPFEPHFPFDSYNMAKSLSFIAPLMRNFSPLAEDRSTLKKELLWKNAIEADCRTYDGSWEFLDDIRRDQVEFHRLANAEVLNVVEERNPLNIADEFLTVYSTSPGLKRFKTSSS